MLPEGHENISYEFNCNGNCGNGLCEGKTTYHMTLASARTTQEAHGAGEVKEVNG